ncbi:hypothetical protein ACFUYE_33110, partial [Micromonospora humida]|uniref:hypothetical protein n=1 Tax=Micromonospora humida TaxID=2809018 RepID=UPI00366EC582
TGIVGRPGGTWLRPAEVTIIRMVEIGQLSVDVEPPRPDGGKAHTCYSPVTTWWSEVAVFPAQSGTTRASHDLFSSIGNMAGN